MRTSTLAVVSLVFGILTWVAMPVLGALVAVITGHLALSEIRRDPEHIEGQGLAIAGTVLGWVNLGFVVLAILAAVLFFGGLAALFAWAG